VLVLFAVGAKAQQQPVTYDAARVDVAAGDYRAALQKIARLLSVTKESRPGERYDLLMLKGECQLQLKDRMGSVTTFKSACKAAGNLEQLAAARANALIVDRSVNGAYRSPSAGGDTIDILNPESRKKAMAALLQDVWSKNKRDIDAAQRAETLPPIEKVFVAVADSYALEVATTGQAGEASAAMKQLGGRAFGLIRGEVSRYARAVDHMNQLANSAQDYRGGWGVTRRGLLPDERGDLREAMEYLSKVQGRVREYREVAAKLGGDPQKWDALVADISDALAEAEVLSSHL
jgi:hypothetical protein